MSLLNGPHIERVGGGGSSFYVASVLVKACTHPPTPFLACVRPGHIPSPSVFYRSFRKRVFSFAPSSTSRCTPSVTGAVVSEKAPFSSGSTTARACSACHRSPRRVDTARRGGRTSPYGTRLQFGCPAWVAQRILWHDAVGTKWVPERVHNDVRAQEGYRTGRVWRTLQARDAGHPPGGLSIGEGKARVERARFCALGAVQSEEVSCGFCKM